MDARADRGGDGGHSGFFDRLTETLIEYAEKRFALDELVEGIPLRAHLEQEEKVTGQTPPELDMPDFPDVARHVWDHFLSIHQGRTYGINGPNPISYQDIESWTRLMGWTLGAWEISAIKRLDAAFLSKREEPENGSG